MKVHITPHFLIYQVILFITYATIFTRFRPRSAKKMALKLDSFFAPVNFYSINSTYSCWPNLPELVAESSVFYGTLECKKLVDLGLGGYYKASHEARSDLRGRLNFYVTNIFRILQPSNIMCAAGKFFEGIFFLSACTP